ncbi:MAG: hypothetical protein LBH17_01500 [Oscillospiraceae bacterium]|nr:hypothetical protein [Oscillospiraceae bacterium]
MKSRTAKRLVFLFTVMSLLLLIVTPALGVDAKAPESAAQSLFRLGLLKGAGTAADGSPNFALDDSVTRAQAAVMIVRLLGKAEEAGNEKWSLPFKDVPDWAESEIGYAHANGIILGASADSFDSYSSVTATQFLTLILRALGYKDGVDFTWDKAWEKTDALGITNGEYNAANNEVTRGSLAVLSLSALDAENIAVGAKLISILVDAGAVSAEAAKEEGFVVESVETTVTFTYDGGAGTLKGALPATQRVPRGARVARPADPQIDGYMFTEWYTSVTEMMDMFGMQYPVSRETAWDFDNPVTADSGTKIELKARFVKPFKGVDGDIVALSLTTATAARGETPYRSVSALFDGEIFANGGAHGSLPVLDSAFSPDMFITYSSGVFRVKTDGKGYITEFYADFEGIQEGYGVVGGNGTVSLGVNPKTYNTAGAKLYNFSGASSPFAVVTAAELSAINNNAMHYWAVVEGSTLKTLYIYNPDTALKPAPIAADKLANIKKFKVEIPAGGSSTPTSPLKYAYYDPTPANASAGSVPLVVWFHGSGFGTNAWDTFFSDSDASPNYIAKWASEEYQKLFGSSGAYILAPSANVHPVIGMEHRWGDSGATQVDLAFDLIDSFVKAHPDIDTSRIYIGGFSVGGGMTMLMAREAANAASTITHGIKFAAAFPCSPTYRTLYNGSGYSADDGVAETLKALPIWLFHSNSEGLTTVGTSYSQAFIKALLEKATVDSRYTVFSDSVSGQFGPQFKLPSGGLTNGHGIAWGAALNNLQSSTGSYLTAENTTYTKTHRDAAVTTLIAWLVAQSK